MNNFKPIINFIRDLYKIPEGFIPLHAPLFNGNEKKYLEECIDTTFVSSLGQFVNRFENMVAEFTGAKKAVVCVNGTNALHIAMLLAGVERNDEVITQPLTFIATCNAIFYIEAFPVFIDIDLDTLGMSPKSLLEFLNTHSTQKINKSTKQTECVNKSSGRRIKACVPMHTFGHPCKIDEIAKICQEFNIELIEDAAESLGSFHKKKHTGTFGKIGIISFNGNKIITTGGGGILLFQNEKMGEYAKHLTTQAKVEHAWEFFHDKIGYNYRMPNINAAVGCAQMEQLPQFLLSKRQIAYQYKDFFSAKYENIITFIEEPKDTLSNYWLNCILLKNRKERDSFLSFTNKKGIMTRPAWQLMNKLPMFKDCQVDELVNANNIENRLVNIPSSVFFNI